MKILTPVYQIKFKKVPNQLLIDERLINELGTWLNRTGRIWACQSSKSARNLKIHFMKVQACPQMKCIFLPRRMVFFV